VTKLFEMWFEGATYEVDGVIHRLCPLRKLKRFDFENQSDKVMLSKAGGVIQEIVDAGRRLGLIRNINDLIDKQRNERMDIFRRSLFYLYQTFICPEATTDDLDKLLIGDKSYPTVYDNICLSKKRDREIFEGDD